MESAGLVDAAGAGSDGFGLRRVLWATWGGS